MPDFFGEIQQQLNEFWQGMDNGQKIKLVSIVILSTLIIAIGVYAISRPSYEVLFSRLDTKDMSDATKTLKELNITYKVSDDGYSLSVPASQKNEAKIGLADANIPKSGSSTTYADAFSKTKLGATESDKTRQYIEFKASEIARALVDNSDSISNAEVFLNISDNSGFFAEDQKSTASVKITPSSELTKAQIEGIARFVANSVSGLDAKNVEVVDNNMKTLKDFDGESTAGADKQYMLAQQVKKNMEKEIREMLSNSSTDYDDVRAVANLKLDFDSEITDAKIVEPVIDGTGAIVSKSEKQENLINGSTGGAPGTDSNSGTTTYPTGSTGDGSSYTNSDVVTNYEYNEKIVKQNKALGQVDKNNSTIAVSLYYGNKIDQTPSQEVIDKVINLVSKATGLSNDKISVESLKIAKAAATKSSFNFAHALTQYGPFVIAAILIILLGVGVFTGTKYRVRRSPEMTMFSRPRHIESVEEIQLEEKSEVKKQIDKFIKQKPEAVANLLRNWLADEWE